MLTVQNITYIHPDKELLFDNISFSIARHQKAALIGNNGSGKSTMLKLISNLLTPNSGKITLEGKAYYVPQVIGQYNEQTIAEALLIADKLKAFHDILDGKATEENMLLLDDDWSIEDRVFTALEFWDLHHLDLLQPMASLSGGQKNKIFLAGIQIHEPDIVLLDEPSNHLDNTARKKLYAFVKETKTTLLIVSHDRQLLNSLDNMLELSNKGIKTYGGNYDFYLEQKNIEQETLLQNINNREKELRKAKEKERETAEKQQRLDARGKKKSEKAGIPRIKMNTLRNNAENSTSKLKGAHAEKVSGIQQDLTDLRNKRPEQDKMKLGFSESNLHQGKVLVELKQVNIDYSTHPLWSLPIDYQLRSGERTLIKGDNGSGKTTLAKIILGELDPHIGTVSNHLKKTSYIDQDYSLINNTLTVYEQAQQYNTDALQEHDIKIRLNRFLFDSDTWNKPCSTLSGGERMRLALCCLTIDQEAPELIVLDEPTNNLDIQNIIILTNAINDYKGTLIVISHDESFLNDIGLTNEIHVERNIKNA